MVNQRDSKNREKFVTFMVLPHSSGKPTLRVNLPRWAAVILTFLLSLVAISLIAFFIYSANITTKMIHYYALQVENKVQEQQIEGFFDKTKKLEAGIRELEKRDQELREMLGIRKKTEKPIQLNSLDSIEGLKEGLALLQQTLEIKKADYVDLKEASESLAYRFSVFPSLAPVPGTIRSPMGWRRHPITGRREFHQGVDIPSYIGMPVRAAADGYVLFSGWAGGYGELVIVNHQNGYRTLYAHNQRLLVQAGQRVSKGEVLAKVGSTGLSTGPHVHYQVEYRGNPVNPERFMDLNILSARNLR